MTKVYDSIIRVSRMGSRKASAESTMTIEDQRRACAEATRRRGARHGRELEALDQSGFTMHESEAMALALDRIARGQSAGIAVAYGDRLFRNWWGAGEWLGKLAKVGGDLVIAGMEDMDYRTPQGRQMMAAMMMSSEGVYHAAKQRGERIAEATMARGVPNRVPFGYMRNGGPDGTGEKVDPGRDGKALVPDPERAQIVAQIFQWRRDGFPWAQIADKLADLNVPAPRSERWTHGTLRSLIQNEAYLGVVVLGERRIEGAHEPLVSPALWRAAQSTRTVSRTGRMVGGLAAGLVVCSGCGKPLSVIGSGDGRLHYGCRRASGDGKCPRPVYIDKDVVDGYVADMIRALVDDERVGSFELVASARELEDARLAAERLRAERAAYIEHADALGDGFRAGLDARNARCAAADERYASLLARADEASDVPHDGKTWDALDAEHQQRVARLLVERVTVTPPRSRSKFAPVKARLRLTLRRDSR